MSQPAYPSLLFLAFPPPKVGDFMAPFLSLRKGAHVGNSLGPLCSPNRLLCSGLVHVLQKCAGPWLGSSPTLHDTKATPYPAPRLPGSPEGSPSFIPSGTNTPSRPLQPDSTPTPQADFLLIPDYSIPTTEFRRVPAGSLCTAGHLTSLAGLITFFFF